MGRPELDVACLTDIGRTRDRNEDAVRISHLDGGSSLPTILLADGMGGHVGGATASACAVDAAHERLTSAGDALGDDPSAHVRAAIHAAHEAVIVDVHEQQGLANAGTTLVVAVVDTESERVVVGHVGDSRAYALTEGALKQVTTDHTAVRAFVEDGELTEAEAEDHPMSHVLAQAVGTADDPSVDVTQIPIPDRLLVCSDGLSGFVPSERVATLLASGDTADCCEALVEAANDAGGKDNVSVAIAASDG